MSGSQVQIMVLLKYYNYFVLSLFQLVLFNYWDFFAHV
jgi:hypothetical protein